MNRFTWPEKPSMAAYPIACQGIPFIVVAAATTIFLALIGFKLPAFLSLLITFFICFFFRDPDRVIREGEGAVSSPADGKVIFAEKVAENPYVEGPCMKISIFMSVFNVHVNRIPFNGKVADIRYFPGKFFNASFDKSSEHNERNAVIIETEQGIRYATVQIAGLVARRIICGLKVGDKVERGTRYGIICFGSRLDVYLPENSELNVSVGEKVQAGTTVLGYIK